MKTCWPWFKANSWLWWIWTIYLFIVHYRNSLLKKKSWSFNRHYEYILFSSIMLRVNNVIVALFFMLETYLYSVYSLAFNLSIHCVSNWSKFKYIFFSLEFLWTYDLYSGKNNQFFVASCYELKCPPISGYWLPAIMPCWCS